METTQAITPGEIIPAETALAVTTLAITPEETMTNNTGRKTLAITPGGNNGGNNTGSSRDAEQI